MKINFGKWVYLLVLIPCLSFGTNQYLEKIIYQGSTNDLLTIVLPNHLAHKIGREMIEVKTSGTNAVRSVVMRKMSSACWRGYKGLWAIEEGSLYLYAVKDVGDNPTPASTLIEGATYPIKADWFSGTLRIPRGEPIIWRYGFNRLYEKEIRITIEKGEVVGESSILNRLDEAAAFKEQVKLLETSPRQIDKDLYTYTFNLGRNFHDKELNALVRGELGTSSNFFNFSRVLVKTEVNRRNLCRLIPTSRSRIYETSSIYDLKPEYEKEGFSFVAFIDNDKAIRLNCPPKNEPGEPYPSKEVVISDAFDRLAQLQESLAGWKPQEHPSVPEGAQVFNSDLPLEIVVNHGCQKTPGKHPIILPENCTWRITINQPIDPVALFKSLEGLEPPLLIFNVSLPDSFFEQAPLLERLTHIRFANGAQFGDAHLNYVSRLPELIELEAWNTHITDTGMVNFCHMGQLQSLKLYGTLISDQGMIHLSGLTQLTHLDLGASNITDVGLESLARLTKLEKLALYESNLGDAAIAQLTGLTNLVDLALSASLLTDEGASLLAELKNHLIFLDLNDSRIGDNGLAHILKAENISILRLNGTRITDVGLMNIATMTKLIRLSVGRTSVTDQGIKSIVKCNDIADLDLNNTAITDQCLPYLYKCKKLLFLNIENTGITAAGIDRLKKELPNCRVKFTKLHNL